MKVRHEYRKDILEEEEIIQQDRNTNSGLQI